MVTTANDWCQTEAPYEVVALDTRPWKPLRSGVMALAVRLHLRFNDVTGIARSLAAFGFRKWPLLFALVTGDDTAIKSAIERLLVPSSDSIYGGRVDLSPDFAFVSRHFPKHCKSVCFDIMHTSMHQLLGKTDGYFRLLMTKLTSCHYRYGSDNVTPWA